MNLKLGNVYIVRVRLESRCFSSKLKFIKVTEKGFNFLNETTNKCVFKHHFYPISKYKKYYKGEMTFFIPKKIIINN